MDTNEFRAAGHRTVDFVADYLDTIAERRVFPATLPSEVEKLFAGALPSSGRPIDALLAELERDLVPNCTHVGHPGYLGLITPSPLPAGILADLLASALNQNLGVYSIGPAAVAMERRVVRWLCELAGYGAVSDGQLTSGGMAANFIGMKLARDWASGDRAQHDGLREQVAVYTSEERHVSVDKAVDAVGLGRESLRKLPTDGAFELRIDALEEAIANDRKKGVRPIAVVALAGTTNLGAVDPLAAIRAICDREGMWMHVDAAYGGGMLLSERTPGLLAGVERADSITIDPHKWFYAPLDAGAILVRDGRQLTRSFGMQPAYLKDEHDARGERYQYYVHGFEQSRRFRGLKVWMSFQRYGSKGIARWIDSNVATAKHLHELASTSSDFASATPPRMSGVCLRYVGNGIGAASEERSARLHARVAQRLEEIGRFWFATTVMKGRTWFRVNVVNLRTRAEHMDELLTLLRVECEAALREQDA